MNTLLSFDQVNEIVLTHLSNSNKVRKLKDQRNKVAMRLLHDYLGTPIDSETFNALCQIEDFAVNERKGLLLFGHLRVMRYQIKIQQAGNSAVVVGRVYYTNLLED